MAVSEKRVDIIIPVFNGLELTRECLNSIKKHSDLSHNLILIDNASADQTKTFLEEFKVSNKDVLLVRNNENLGWVKAVNQGIALSSAPYVCIMNNDTVVKTGGWLSGLVSVAEIDRDIGLVNPRFDLRTAGSGPSHPCIEIDFCRGYCILIKREVIERIGGLDEAYGLGYYDDDDYSVRAIRAGFRCMRANDVTVEHLRDSTFSAIFPEDKRRALHENNKKLFYSRWGRRLRLVFIVTRSANRKIMTDALLSLARKQHVIHLWNATVPFDIGHINIRERLFRPLLSNFLFPMALYANRIKSAQKRYNAVFVDNKVLKNLLSMGGGSAYLFDIGKDSSTISEIVDSQSKGLI